MKKQFFYLLVCLLATACQADKTSQTNPNIVHEFDLNAIAEESGKLSALPEGGGWQFAPDSAGQLLSFSQALPAWAEARYLVVELDHDLPNSLIVYLDFFRQGGEQQVIEQQGEVLNQHKPRISAKIGVLPHLPTQVVFPLAYLDGQEIFMPRYPRQLKGTVLGSRLDPKDISEVALRLEPYQLPDYQPSATIKRIWLAADVPAPLPAPAQPLVDAFGQWTARQWPEKIQDQEQLRQVLGKQLAEANTTTFPENWSQYGGWKGKRFEATGFFRTHHDGQRWWLVDPDGYPFVSMGMDCVRDRSEGSFGQQKDLFATFPNGDDVMEKDCYSQRKEEHLVDFYKWNLMRAFGQNWRESWEKMSTGLLVKARFNTIANWSDLEYAKKAKLPYVLPLADFPTTRIQLYRDFPDVFSDEYKQNAVQFAKQLESYRDDPYLIGYFLRNEPHWAFGYHNLAFEMFGTTQSSATKTEFIRWIKDRYQGQIASLNQAWNIQLADFEALANTTFKDMPNKKADDDFYAFSEIMVGQYVGLVCDEVEKVDANHLNLGMRYAWLSSNLLYKAGERFDVFSINGYSFPAPPATADIARISGKPVMIGEFHFGATDRGLPANGIQGVATQADRAKAYRHYMEQGFARPEVIGLHYFQWNDQPLTGRFDGENYNIGFLDITAQPYPELFEAARISHERMYEVATGKAKPYDSVAVKAPQIFY